MANQFLSLSLFLMLLSFFIVLNSVSNFEEIKSRPIMNSLSLAFSGQPPVPVPANVGDVDNEKQAAREGDTLEEIEGLFKGHIAGFEARRNRFGTVMHTRVPVGKFENALDFGGYSNLEVVIGDRGAFLPTLITLLRAEEKDKPYRMDMMLNIPESPVVFQKNKAQDFMKALKRVGGFAERLERMGMPRKMVSAGLQKGDVGIIDIYIYPYKGFDLIEYINTSKKEGGE